MYVFVFSMVFHKAFLQDYNLMFPNTTFRIRTLCGLRILVKFTYTFLSFLYTLQVVDFLSSTAHTDSNKHIRIGIIVQMSSVLRLQIIWVV